MSSKTLSHAFHTYFEYNSAHFAFKRSFEFTLSFHSNCQSPGYLSVSCPGYFDNLLIWLPRHNSDWLILPIDSSYHSCLIFLKHKSDHITPCLASFSNYHICKPNSVAKPAQGLHLWSQFLALPTHGHHSYHSHHVKLHLAPKSSVFSSLPGFKGRVGVRSPAAVYPDSNLLLLTRWGGLRKLLLLDAKVSAMLWGRSL